MMTATNPISIPTKTVMLVVMVLLSCSCHAKNAELARQRAPQIVLKVIDLVDYTRGDFIKAKITKLFKIGKVMF